MTTVVHGRSRNVVSRRAPAPPASRGRRTAILATIAIAAAALLSGAGAVVWQQLLSPTPFNVSLGTPISANGLALTVEDFGRRADAMMGVNTPEQPMSGPAMPMGAAPDSSGSMAGMPGMAGMLEHGQERVDIAVVVTNGGDGTQPLDPADFALFSEGRPVELLAETTTTLTQTPLAEGASMAGNLTFVVPVGTAPLELGYGDGAARVLLEPTSSAGDTPAGAEHDGAQSHSTGNAR